MSAEIFTLNGSCPPSGDDGITAADEFDSMAKAIRDGDVSFRRGILVYQRKDGTIAHIGCGDDMTALEAVGLLAWGIEQCKQG